MQDYLGYSARLRKIVFFYENLTKFAYLIPRYNCHSEKLAVIEALLWDSSAILRPDS